MLRRARCEIVKDRRAGTAGVPACPLESIVRVGNAGRASGTWAFCFVLFRVFRGSAVSFGAKKNDPRITRNNTKQKARVPLAFLTQSMPFGDFGFRAHLHLPYAR